MRKVKYPALLLFVAIFLLNGCKKNESTSVTDLMNSRNEPIDKQMFPSGFNYGTTKDVDFQIQLSAPDGNPIQGVPVQINRIVNGSLVKLFVIVTDKNGLASGFYSVPADLTELVISPNYVSIPNHIIVPLTGKVVALQMSGKGITGSGAHHTFESLANLDAPHAHHKSTSSLNIRFLSSYNNDGVPSVMASPEVITTQMLNYVNNSIPESRSVPVYHPEYLQQNLNTNIDIIHNTEVWLTFVHEGAGYRNTLGFYKYPTGNPPTSPSQIDTVFIAFPNASFYNSGGGLQSGDRVSIGNYTAGTSIGFVCISNGWNGNSVGGGNFQIFSDPNLNAPTNPTLKQHSVLLYDEANKVYYLGFEDIQRDNNACDNDFNDIVFYLKSSETDAISTYNIASVDKGEDTDGDGVFDMDDDFPTDATLAYKNYLPAPNVYGTLSFEDLWPGKGDYDFNDMVVGYQFEQCSNAQNEVKEMNCRFVLRAIGAHYKHGFGFQMNISPSEISSVTGSRIFDNYISLSGNNTEASQNLATIIAFDNDYRLANRSEGDALNTDMAKTYRAPDTTLINIQFSSPKSQTSLGTAPFNPFIVVAGNRGNEIHLAGCPPTSLANSALFGTYQDNTNVGFNNYYKTKNNLPYALNLSGYFAYTKEQTPINHGYLKFIEWAQSSGAAFPDWYKSNAGNIDGSKIYTH